MPRARHAATLSENALRCKPISPGFLFRGAERLEHCLTPKGQESWAVWEHIRKNPGEPCLQTNKPIHTNQASLSTPRIPPGFRGQAPCSWPSGLPSRVAGKASTACFPKKHNNTPMPLAGDQRVIVAIRRNAVRTWTLYEVRLYFKQKHLPKQWKAGPWSLTRRHRAALQERV